MFSVKLMKIKVYITILNLAAQDTSFYVNITNLKKVSNMIKIFHGLL